LRSRNGTGSRINSPSPPRLAHAALAADGVLPGLLTVVLILID
jgi:hypothetical protein